MVRLANREAESKEPYELIALGLGRAFGNVRGDSPGNAGGSVEILRLRDCFAKRSNHCAQDDSAFTGFSGVCLNRTAVCMQLFVDAAYRF